MVEKLKFFWPFLFILLVWLLLFSPVFLKGYLPIPSDIITGVYYPWLDYKWGFSVGVPVKNPLISDIPSILYPWRSLVVDELKVHRWPLWNPYYFTGMPLLANFQSAVFSYVNLFFLFFAKPIAWSFGVMTSPLLTMLVMYLFLRHKELAKTSALLGAVVFSLSGFEIAWLEYNVHGHTALFLPLLLFLIDKIYEGKSKIWLMLLPIFVALQIFTGYVPVVIYTYLICLLYIGYFYLLPGLRKGNLSLKRHTLLVLFWGWGILLAGVQLLPGWELAKISIRLTDPTVEASDASYLPIANLVTLLAPDFFGNPATGNYFGKAFYDNFYFFAGTGTLIFVLYSLFSLRKGRDIRFWFGLLILSFILVFKNPLGMFLEKIFFLSGGVAAKALFITDFSLAILAGLGLERFLKGDSKRKQKVLLVIAFIGLLFGLLIGRSFKLEDAVNRLIAQRNIVIPLVVFLVSSAILVFITFTGVISVKARGIGIIFVVLISGQLLYSARKYLPFSKKELLFPRTPVIDFLLKEQSESKEPFRVEINDVIPQNFLMPYGLQTTSGYDALLPRRTGEFISILESGKIPEKISRVQLIKNYDSLLFPLTNTKYILAKKQTSEGIFSPDGKPPDQLLNSRYELVFEDRTVQIYEDKKFLPRAFWVHDFIVGSRENVPEILDLKLNLSKKIVLENKINFIAPSQESKLNSLEWVENRPGKKVLVTQSDQPGFVFLSESFFPGWKVFVDGIPSVLLRANYNFQTVQVGEGRHLISFEYKPQSFHLGSLISLFSLVQLIFLSILFFLKTRWEKVS